MFSAVVKFILGEGNPSASSQIDYVITDPQRIVGIRKTEKLPNGTSECDSLRQFKRDTAVPQSGYEVSLHLQQLNKKVIECDLS